MSALHKPKLEEDHPLPGWWLSVFFASIAFSFGYWFIFHTTHALPSAPEEYRAQLAALDGQRGPLSDQALTSLSHDAAAVAEGQQVFASTCAACHGPQGQGLVGPNLTDKFWLHGSRPAQLLATVTHGVPEKAMPPWGRVLGEDKVRKVVAFLLTLKGRNLSGKAPQGEPLD